MRTLSAALTAAQKAASRAPYVKIEARNDPLGVVNLAWERLYSGSEADGRHALAMAGDGSLIRMRISAASQSRLVYRQRVTEPGSTSDFSGWIYLGIYNAANCAACALGAEVSLFWVKANGEIDYMQSADYGATWGTLEFPGYGSGAEVGGMTAAYRANCDVFLFFTDTSNLYLIKRLSGVWQTRINWNQTTGALCGVAVIYDGDWKLLVSGRDTDGRYCLWSLIYGDGAELAAGTWGSLQLIQQAPADCGYSFGAVFMDKPDVFRQCCNEAFSGVTAYNRPLLANSLPESAWTENLWGEPRPFNFQNSHGLALAHDAAYAWLTCPSGVWRAPLAVQNLDLSGDLLTLQHSAAAGSGKAVIELQNSTGKYASPGNGALAALSNGCRLDISPGYRTAAGQEYSAGISLILRGYEHLSAGGKASLKLFASDGWDALCAWQARYPLRWNAASNEASVKDLLTWLLARAGIKLTVNSQSTLIVGFYPDFMIQAGDNGAAAVEKLLSFVPDGLFIEGGRAYLVDPAETDSAAYIYGAGHAILEASYRQDAAAFNRVLVEGWQAGAAISGEVFDWLDLETSGERLTFRQDINLETAALAAERGQIILRKLHRESAAGWIRAPLNCGLQLLDVIAITDSRAGLTAVRQRVTGYTWSYLPAKGQYEQKIFLGEI